jgi:HD-GYP domain-containing protein (c-di-GMP phosphodiesterase class II)
MRKNFLSDETYTNLMNVKYLEDRGFITDFNKMVSCLKDLKDISLENFSHSERVAMYSKLIAQEYKLSKEEIDCIWISALLHDIGKVKFPKSIFSNNDELTKEELDTIRKHPYDGYLISKDFFTNDLALPILEHHERLDGSGYPYKKNNISLNSKIIAVADTFDAMTSKRLYQDTTPYLKAIKKIKDLSIDRKLYDLDVIEKLENVVLEKFY